MWWKPAKDDSLTSRFVRGGMHSISDVRHLELKLAVLENMLKELSIQTPRLLRLLWCRVLTAGPWISHLLCLLICSAVTYLVGASDYNLLKT